MSNEICSVHEVGYPKPARYLPRIASWFWVSPSPWTPIAWSKSEPFWLRRVRSQRPLAASVLLGAPLAIRYWSWFIDKLNISHSLTILLVATSQTLARSVVLSARHQDFLSPCLASLGDKIVALYNRLLFLIGACPLFVCLLKCIDSLMETFPDARQSPVNKPWYPSTSAANSVDRLDITVEEFTEVTK